MNNAIEEGNSTFYRVWAEKRVSMTRDDVATEKNKIHHYKKELGNIFLKENKREAVRDILVSISTDRKVKLFQSATMSSGPPKGGAYHQIEQEINRTTATIVSDVKVAKFARSILQGKFAESSPPYLVSLLAAWFISECIRYEQSYVTSLMVLDLIQAKVADYNFSNACIYSTCSVAKANRITKEKEWKKLVHKEEHKIKDLFGKAHYYQYLVGLHPMANLGSG